ncbi:MAG: flagellar hook-associated protein FlgK, partial [Methylobacterium sp.]|nr:flagellar hook-associated protein FlgK [Methylobacterium sp.]
MSILNTATRALQSTQLAIATTSHNIANVNTPGFRRQEAVFTTNAPVQSGSGFIGQGVNVSTVRRVYSEFLERQVSQTEAQAGYLSQYLAGAKQIDNVFGDRSVGFSSAIQNFYTSWNALANSPASIPARQGVIGAANSLVTNLRGVGDYLESLQDSVNADIASMVGEVNSYARTIADLNDRIASVQNYDTLPPNDLLDQRDQAISELNDLAGATVVKDASTGAYNVFLGRGYQLVNVAGALPVSAKGSSFDPLRTEVYGSGGGVQLSGDLGIIGGRLGGLLDYRAEMLDAAQNSLGQIAIALAQNT